MRHFIKNYKRLLLSVLMTVFLGQSLTAAASPCVMMGDASSQTPSESMDHHKHAEHGATDKMEQADASCCENGGYCSLLNCAPVFAMPTAMLNLSLAPMPQTGSIIIPSIPHFSPATPFKPPISA